MKIVKLEAENIKKLRCVEITPSGDIVQITGENGSGKSSVLDSIWWALGGSKNIQGKPIRRGQEKAKIKLDLGEIEILRSFTEDGSTLSVTGDGTKFASPQKMLDEMFNALAFDPLAFSRMDAKAQFGQLRKLVDLKIDPEAMDAENRFDYEKRATLNRQYKELEAQIGAFPEFPDDLPETEVDVSSLAAKISAASAKNAEIDIAIARRQDAAKMAERNKAAAATRISELDKAMTEAKANHERATQRLIELSAEKDEQKSDVSKEITALDKSRETNKLIGLKAGKVKAYDAAKKLFLEAEDLTEGMKKRTAKKLDALSKVKMPVKGLTFGEGMVLYNGVPMDQASTAEQIRVSCAIGMQNNSKLRVMLIKEGSLLDKNSMKIVADMAKEHDWQVWIETVQSSDKTAILMEDGNAIIQSKGK